MNNCVMKGGFFYSVTEFSSSVDDLGGNSEKVRKCQETCCSAALFRTGVTQQDKKLSAGLVMRVCAVSR